MTENTNNEVSMEIKLRHSKPVDVITMANSLIALNNLALEHISKEHGIKDTKILLTGVKEGSDIYQLIIQFAAASLPIVENITAVGQFVEYIRSFLTIETKPIEDVKNSRHYSMESVKNVENFISPIEDSSDNSEIQIKVEGDNNSVNVLVFKSEDKAKILENSGIVKKIRGEEQPKNDDTHKFYKEVLIELHRVTNTTKEVKDSAYCDDILKGKAIPTIFKNEKEKATVLDNPFHALLLVDMEVRLFNDKIQLYTITKLHKIIPNEKGEADE
ncbi:MAG: hypothetical protein LBI78_07425 [Campylobacteraceae bacterium]|jgi:hypothetical protein|nr:hypothetical protein [Campylobacteraceae bacterium]